MNRKIEFSLPTNWEDDLIERITKKNVAQLFGKLNNDFIGGGRLSAAIPFVRRKKVARHIARMHECGLGFNYIINGSCLDNREWTRRGQKEIRRLLGWLVDIGADSVTVTVPYLAEITRKLYPGLKIEVSSFAEVDTVQRARHWADLGVDVITLASHKINRDFKLIRGIREAVSCKLQLIANNCCLDACIYHNYHANISSHASQARHKSRYLLMDHCKLLCIFLRLKYADKIISSGWIRPEDLVIYEEAGIDRIKLVDRQMTTGAICNIAKAYTDGRYDGNFYDLLPGPSKSINLKGLSLLRKFPFFVRQAGILPILLGVKRLARPEKIFIDNRDLDGFLNFFLEEKCKGICGECGYCYEVAQRVVKIDNAYYRDFMRVYDNELRDIISLYL